MAELLIVVGILAVLTAVTIPAIIAYTDNLRQTQYDDTARQIFVTAQNKMTNMASSGEWSALQGEHSGDAFFGSAMEAVPTDYPGGSDAYAMDESNLKVLTYSAADPDKSGSLLSKLLPAGSLDDTIITDGYYVLEYNEKTATVYGVFYSEKEISYSDVLRLNARSGRTDKETRRDYQTASGIKTSVGYYGGTKNGSLNLTSLLPISLDVINEEELIVKVTDPNSKLGTAASMDTRVKVVVTGSQSGQTAEFVFDPVSLSKADTMVSCPNSNVKNLRYTASDSGSGIDYYLTLDSITEKSLHFANQFPDFIPGENITVTAYCSGTDSLAEPVTATAQTNSLFASVTESGGDYRANISWIRHLENLDPDISGINASTGGSNHVIAAKLLNNLDFEGNFAYSTRSDLGYSYWKNYYQENTIVGVTTFAEAAADRFAPIVNRTLTEVTGKTVDSAYKTIYHLNIYEDESKGAADLGLFASYEGSISGLGVADSEYYGCGNIGGLVGTLKGDSTLENCFANVKIGDCGGGDAGSGNLCAGGLIGRIEDGSGSNVITVSNCFVGGFTRDGSYVSGSSGSSTKIRNANVWLDTNKASWSGNAGGFVGEIYKTSGSVTISHCYTTASVGIQEHGNATSSNYYCGAGFVGHITVNDSAASVLTDSCYCTGQINSNWTMLAGKLNLGNFVGRVDKISGSSIQEAYATFAFPHLFNYRTSKVVFKSCKYLNGMGIDDGDTNKYSRSARDNENNYTDIFVSRWNKNANGDIQAVDKLNSFTDSAGKVFNHSISAANTHAVDSTLKGAAYSYADITGMQVHFGDWPKVLPQAQLLYYEIYDYGTENSSGVRYSIGFYNETLEIDTLIEDPDAGGVKILRDGYALMSTTDDLTDLSMTSVTDTSNGLLGTEDFITSTGITDSISLDTNPNGDEESSEEETSFAFSSSLLQASTQVTLGKWKYSFYFLNSNLINAQSASDSYYSTLKVTLNKNSGNDDSQTYSFCFQPHAAMSAISRGGSLSNPDSSAVIPIRTQRQLAWMTKDTDTGRGSSYFAIYSGLNYKLIRSLDFGDTAADLSVTPVFAATTQYGSVLGYSGTFDGNSKTISNLTISETGTSANGADFHSAGLFGTLAGATIKNLTMDKVSIVYNPFNGEPGSLGQYDVGSGILAGYVTTSAAGKYTTISNVVISNSSVAGTCGKVGGLAGAISGGAVSQISLNANTVSGYTMVGGAFGAMSNQTDLAVSNLAVTGGNVYELYGPYHSYFRYGQGTGGFAGNLTHYGSHNLAIVNCALNSLSVTVMENSNEDSERYASGGLWIGEFTESASVAGSSIYSSCTVTNCGLSTVARGLFPSRNSYGSLYGTLIGPESGQAYYVAAPSDVIFYGCSIVNGSPANKNKTGLCVGGYIGCLQSHIGLTFTAAWPDYTMASLKNYTAATCDSLGGLLGSMENHATLGGASLTAVYNGGSLGADTSTGLKSLAFDGSQSAKNMGILVGYAGGFADDDDRGDLSTPAAAVGNSAFADEMGESYIRHLAVTLTGAFDAGASVNFGLIGRADNCYLENITVTGGSMKSDYGAKIGVLLGCSGDYGYYSKTSSNGSQIYYRGIYGNRIDTINVIGTLLYGKTLSDPITEEEKKAYLLGEYIAPQTGAFELDSWDSCGITFSAE